MLFNYYCQNVVPLSMSDEVEAGSVGETLSVYSVIGTLVYQNISSSNEAEISLSVKGIYFVRQGSKTLKVVN